jgi:DNA repair exonuclease SbcCD ATPase subunit/DNA repair exonuclease SbcCD nuclease subunit
MIKIAHISDIHANKKNKAKIEKALDFTFAKIAEIGVDAILISGDTFDGDMPTGYDTPYHKMIEKIVNAPAPVHICQGTPSHDIPGAINVFELLGSQSRIAIYDKPAFSNCEVTLSVLPAISKGVLAGSNPGLSPRELNDLAHEKLREILKDFGAKAIVSHPHILMLHYAIEGSVYSSGQEQRGDEIVLSVEDLRLANPDYVAAGHIHNHIQPNLPDWVSYAGSLIHSKADEHEEKGFKIVTFDDNGRLSDIQFIRATSIPIQTVDIEVVDGTWNKPDNIHADSHLKVRVTGPDYELTDDIRKQIEDFADAQNADNKIVYIPTIRPKPIIEDYPINATLIEKVRKFCESRKIVLSDSAAAKVEELAKIGGHAAVSSSSISRGFELTYVKIRGAKGLKSYGDEVELDFSKFGTGLIALEGINGAGKTTFLENCHPWARVLYRKESLQYQYYLKDSYRELHFDLDGKKYISKILITPPEGSQRSKISCYLYADGQLVNKEDTIKGYEQVLERLLCSPEIYFKLIFQVQGADKIGAMTATPLKNFFNKLFGLDLYPILQKICKDNKAEAEKELAGVIAIADEIRAVIENDKLKLIDKNSIIADRDKAEQEKAILEGNIAENEHLLAELQDKLNKIAEIDKDINRITAEIEEIGNTTDNIRTQKESSITASKKRIAEIESDIGTINAKLAIKDDYLKALSEIAELEVSHTEAEEKQEEIWTEIEAKNIEVNQAKRSIGQHKADTAIKLKPIESKLAVEQEAIKTLNDRIAEADDIRAAVDKLSVLQKEIDALNDKADEVADIDMKLQSAEYKYEAKKLSIERELANINDQIDLHTKNVKTLDKVPCTDNKDFVATCKFIKSAGISKGLLETLIADKEKLLSIKLSELPEAIVVENLNAAKKAIGYDKNEHNRIKVEYAELNSKNPTQALQDINNATAILFEKQKLIDNYNTAIESLKVDSSKFIDDTEAAGVVLLNDLAELKTSYSKALEYDGMILSQKLKLEKDCETRFPDELLPLEYTYEDKRDLSGISVAYDKLGLALAGKRQELEYAHKSIDDTIDNFNSTIIYWSKKNTELMEGLSANKILRKNIVLGDAIKEDEVSIDIHAIEAKVSEEQLGEMKALRQSYNNKLGELNEAIIEAKARLSHLENLEAELQAAESRLIEQEDIRGRLNADISDWNLLIEVFGRNGLQVVELTAACPEISDIASDILRHFNKDWALYIMPTKPSADNSRDLDDFYISLSTDEGHKTYDNLSEGERVWVDQSLKKAGIIYIINNTGYSFRTLIQDEGDGDLNEDSIEGFLATAMRSHDLTQAHHTLIVSHRESILNSISQKIIFDKPNGCIRIEYA